MFHRRKTSLPPINSQKHYVQTTFNTIAAAAKLTLVIAEAVELAAVSTPTEIREGSLVKAVYVEMWISGDATSAQSTGQLNIEKKVAGKADITFAEMQLLNDYPNKKNIYYATQGLFPPSTQAAIPFLRQWIKIPKGKQRFGLGDTLVMNISSITGVSRICGICVYKEYF